MLVVGVVGGKVHDRCPLAALRFTPWPSVAGSLHEAGQVLEHAKCPLRWRCRGQLLDSYQPQVKEGRAVAFTSWNGHAFFYKSAKTVAGCDDTARIAYRSERKDTVSPP